MTLDELEEKLSSYGAGGYYLLELFVTRLLELEAAAHQQPMSVESRESDFSFDAFAPAGLGTLRGPLAIEISHSLSERKFQAVLKRSWERIRSDGLSLLLISLRPPQSVYRVPTEFEIHNTGVHIWGPEKIQDLIDKYPEAAKSISEGLFSSRLKSTIDKKADDWKTQRELLIGEVRSCYGSGRFSIWLGAGVSSSAGLPDWNTLLNSLFVSMLTEGEPVGDTAERGHISSIVDRLRQVDGPSSLMLARYIRKGLSIGSTKEQDHFTEAVTRQLYGLRNSNFALASPLITALAAMCMPSRTGAKVRSVLTYNFDDLLERQLLGRGLQFRSIFEEIDLPSAEELPVYHVHGFLPENRANYPNLNKSTLVFSEEGYHHIYRESYHWSNLIQLNNLKETTCVMVGLSLTDPNLRRLLEISAKNFDKPRHFAFLKRIGLDQFSKEGGKNVVDAPPEKVAMFLERHHNLNEEVMRELGVNIIWYENYDEIPMLLGEIQRVLT